MSPHARRRRSIILSSQHAWRGYQVLGAVQDTQTKSFLALAHRLLQQRAKAIGDETQRRLYLENVPENRAILELMLRP